MKEIQIREAAPQDAEKILSYMKQIGGETDNLTYGAQGLPITVGQEQAFLQDMRDDAHCVFYCAWKDGTLVGTGSLSGLPRRMSHRGELGISVLKAEWGRGIGSMLMRSLITYARRGGIELINLEVRSDNAAAIHLYEKFGFQRIGTSPAFFKVGTQYVDFDLMYLDLRQPGFTPPVRVVHVRP